MNQVANQRALRAAVERLARIDVDVDDVSRAIDAFGQVLADLTETPLAVISGEAFEENNELRAKVARLESELRLMRLTDKGMKVDTAQTILGFKVVEDPTLAPGAFKITNAQCRLHEWEPITFRGSVSHHTCMHCGVRK